MNKKLKNILIPLLCIVLVVVIISVACPYLVLSGARQPEVEESYAYSEYFYNSYDEIRAHLKDRVSSLAADGISVEVTEYAIDEADELYIDNIYMPAEKENKNLIVLTTGVHGIEGYIGAVMLDMVMNKNKH